MASNLKIVVKEYDQVTPNRVNFNNTVTLPGTGSVALTSFNATLDIDRVKHDLPAQVLGFYWERDTGSLTPRNTLNVPAKTYDNPEDIQLTVKKAINQILRYNTLHTGVSTDYDGAKFDIIPAQNTGDLTECQMTFTALTAINFQSSVEANEDNDYVDAELEMLDDEAATTQYLLRGGGVAAKIPLYLSFNNTTQATSISWSVKRGPFISRRNVYSLNWSVISGVPYLYLTIKLSGTPEVRYDVLSEDFYDYKDKAATTGPFAAYRPGAYFKFIQYKGRVEIGYVDETANTYYPIYWGGRSSTQQAEGFEWTSNQFVLLSAVVKNSNSIPKDKTFATLEKTAKKVGNAHGVSPYINFEFAPDFQAIFGAKTRSYFSPPNNYTSSFKSFFDYLTSPLTNFELALEIDNIQVENYVGYKNNDQTKNPGRKNIIAYFTPNSLLTRDSYVWSFVPPEPIYLKLATKGDIQLNNLTTRIYNTFTEENFKASSLTYVLSVKP